MANDVAEKTTSTAIAVGTIKTGWFPLDWSRDGKVRYGAQTDRRIRIHDQATGKEVPAVVQIELPKSLAKFAPADLEPGQVGRAEFDMAVDDVWAGIKGFALRINHRVVAADGTSEFVTYTPNSTGWDKAIDSYLKGTEGWYAWARPNAKIRPAAPVREMRASTDQLHAAPISSQLPEIATFELD